LYRRVSRVRVKVRVRDGVRVGVIGVYAGHTCAEVEC